MLGAMLWILIYVLTGAFIGVLSGLLGVGGGMTLVPILSALFDAQSLAPRHAVHLALGTAMATAVVTASASVRAHHTRGAVDWRIASRLAPGMIAGSTLSSFASGWVPQRALALAFALIVYFGATQMLMKRREDRGVTMPGPSATVAVGLAFGIVCGLVSAGGAFMTVPWMLHCGVPLLTAIGTGVAIGVPVLLAGTVGYVASGWNAGDLPPMSLGFVYLPAALALVVGSMPFTSVGAHLAHRLPGATLKKIFAFVLFALATRMLMRYW